MISAKIGSDCASAEAARSRCAGAVGLVEGGFVDDADLQPRGDLLQRGGHLQRVLRGFSSWHGPAMIEIGRSLPNLTVHTVTTGAAAFVRAQGQFSSFRRDHSGDEGADQPHSARAVRISGLRWSFRAPGGRLFHRGERSRCQELADDVTDDLAVGLRLWPAPPSSPDRS